MELTNLQIQVANGSVAKLKAFLIGSIICGYEIPNKQSLCCTWELRFFFEDKTSYLVVSSDVASAGGWEEFGYLKCELVSDKDKRDPNDIFNRVGIKKMPIESISLLINVDKDVEAECGIVLHSSEGHEVIVSTAPAPGAVSVLAPFNSDEYKPEVLIEQCESRAI